MKKLLSLAICLMLSTSVWAALPVVDGFYDFNSSQWEQFWTNDAFFSFVDASSTSVGDSPLGTSKIIECGIDAPTYSSFGIITGEDTDADYNLKVQMYTPIVNTDAEPEDYWYQMLIFYRDSGGYGRFHTQFNEFGGTIPDPRIRLQVSNPGFVHTTGWTSPTDFSHSEGWHEMKLEISGTTADCYFDGNLLGNADWTADAATRTAGKFGIGGFCDGTGTLTNYFAGFKAWQGAEPADPSPPTAADSQSWTYYE